MLGIGLPDLLIVGVVALVMFGPDRLPELARSLARLVHNLRRLATTAQQGLRDELGPEFADLSLADLDPRTALRQQLLRLAEPVQVRAVEPPDGPELPSYVDAT